MKSQKMFTNLVCFLCLLAIQESLALPIDITGVFGADTTRIDSYRRNLNTASNAGDGNFNPGIPSGKAQNAKFQSYKLILKPVIVVNDSATFHSEITTGYGYGGRFGDDSTFKKSSTSGSFGNALYIHNNPSGNSNISFTKFNAELFSDAGTYIIGRQSHDWALGAIFDAGNDTWDRFSTTKDGLLIKLKFSNFFFTPYYFKTNANGSLTENHTTKEYGVSMLYDNPQRDIAFGILFAKKRNSSESEPISDITGQKLANANVKITDIYFSKSFGKLTLKAEVPIIGGDAGNVFENTESTKYKASAIITETNYVFNETWSAGFGMGRVTGEDGSNASFDAMFLNPNYQIANLMFRYNLEAVADPTNKNIFDSHITNALYVKLHGTYDTGKWRWNAAYIWAKALESASVCLGSQNCAYNHMKNKIFDANFAQKDDYGHEIDLDFDYAWNENVEIGGSFGYHFVGDYYGYNNTASSEEIENTYMLQLRTAISF